MHMHSWYPISVDCLMTIDAILVLNCVLLMLYSVERKKLTMSDSNFELDAKRRLWNLTPSPPKSKRVIVKTPILKVILCERKCLFT